MSPETYEQLIYLPDDNPFFRMPEDKFHRRKLAIRAIALTVLAVGVYVRLLWSGGFIWLDETRLHELSAAIGHNLVNADWQRKREIIRTLVQRLR